MGSQLPSSHVLRQYSQYLFQLFTIDDIFTEEDLSKFHQVIDGGDEKTPTFTSSAFKNGKIVSKEISRLIWERIKSYLPTSYVDSAGRAWKFIGVPHVVMYAEINSGQQFGIHTDTGYIYENNGKIKSSHTLLIYLNDDFECGTTQFFDNKYQQTVCIQPQKNKTLCFDIELSHRGDAVCQGVKRWLGTELVSECDDDHI